MSDDEFLRTRQRALYGTTEWNIDYHRRNHVESFNSHLKSKQSQWSRATIQVRTLMRRAVLLAFKVAALNLAILDSATARGIDPTVREPDRRHYSQQIRMLRVRPTRKPTRAPPAPPCTSCGQPAGDPFTT